MPRKNRRAVAYLCASPAKTNGADEDSVEVQRTAITVYAKTAGFEIVAEFHDQAVSDAEPIADRPGFTEMLATLPSNGAKTIIVQDPEHFSRDLMLQLDGHDMLKAKGITLVAASAPAYFLRHSPGYFRHRPGPFRSDDPGKPHG